MALDTRVQKQLENALGNPYLAANMVSVINTAVAGAGVVSIGGVNGVITAAAGRTALGLGTAATHASTDFQATNAVLGAISTAGVQAVTGSKGANAALASLIAALVAQGLITDGTS